MAVLEQKVLSNLSRMLSEADSNKKETFRYDPIIQIGFRCLGSDILGYPTYLKVKEQVRFQNIYKKRGLVGVIQSFYLDGILDTSINSEIERKVIVLKTSFSSLPATTCKTVLAGFKINLEEENILQIYASLGLTRKMKTFSKKYKFLDINRFAIQLEDILNESIQDTAGSINELFEAMFYYFSASEGKREEAIRNSNLNRSSFFHYWKRFCLYGVLGLVKKGKLSFREGKIGFKNEGEIVINSLQKPTQKNIYYVENLRRKGLTIQASNITKIFQRWDIKSFESAFIDNLDRLSTDSTIVTETVKETQNKLQSRYVDSNFITLLSGMKKYCLHTDAPGLFVLFSYIEKLKLFPFLEEMNLTQVAKGYSWSDLFLFNIARIFYGISTYTTACEVEEPTLAFFSGLLKSPCNDSLLNGLEEKITEKDVYLLRKHLIKQGVEHKLIEGKNIAFDFHQIDLDIKWSKIRKIGKGPSPKKNICYNGFRPHIAWDLSTNCLIVNEFRKSSARGTSTTKPYVKDYLLDEFKDIFENIYIDSEYTGKDLWNFIIDKENGCGANLTACLKQNALVKKYRDLFILENSNNNDFWIYYDDNYVISKTTFKIEWETKVNGIQKNLTLNCLVKKSLKNAKLRCFGTSKDIKKPTEILKDYSERWLIENGIKDLVISYYINQIAGTNPHLADIHFLTVTVCRYIYKMIEYDLGEDILNADGSTKTLDTMRKKIFTQGAGTIYFKNNSFEIEFLNSYSLKMTNLLKKLYSKVEKTFPNGLSILGGRKISFKLQTPKGEEFKNSFKKTNFSSHENF